MAEAEALVRSIMEKGPLAVRLVLEAVDAGYEMSQEDALLLEANLLRPALAPRPTCARAPAPFSRSGSPPLKGTRRPATPSPNRLFCEAYPPRDPGFRNLADGELELPPRGFALVGPNGQGKTNLLEAVVLPGPVPLLPGRGRSELVAFNGRDSTSRRRSTASATAVPGRDVPGARAEGSGSRVDDVEEPRGSTAARPWLAVAFLPADVELAAGSGSSSGAGILDRMLSLADRRYLRALLRYRAALAQRNAALRQQQADVAQAFEPILADAGRRCWWSGGWRGSPERPSRSPTNSPASDEAGRATLRYTGARGAGRARRLDRALSRGSCATDRARGITTVGPHRDDLVLALDGQPLREFGSTGQQRSAAVALKLLELATLRERARHRAGPAAGRRVRRAGPGAPAPPGGRLLGDGQRQVFVTAPRQRRAARAARACRGGTWMRGRATPGRESA